jgi:hypothetical protein
MMHFEHEQVEETNRRSSAVILRWNLDFSSLMTEESISFPLEKLILPR